MGLPVEINSLMLGGDAGYRIERSVRLRRSASAYFTRTFATAPTLSTRYTLSFWLKRGQLSLNQGIFGARQSASPYELITFETGDTIFWQSNNGLGVRTSAVYRDTNAWYHFMFVIDTTEATAANRAKMFVNGVQQTYSTAAYPTLNSSAVLGSAIANWIGGEHNGSGITSFFDGYIAEVNFIDGQALPTSSFGYTDSQTGVWTPQRYTGTYGTNGYYLKFTDNSAATATTIGRDFSGNTNNWTPTNISVTLGTTYDSMLDSPTNYADGGNGRGNYGVLNPLSRLTTVSPVDGNLSFTTASSGVFGISSFAMSSGKWYWEAQTSAGTTQTRAAVYSSAASAYYSFVANNTVYGFRFDADAGTFEQTADGTTWNSIATGLLSGPYFAYFNSNGTTSKTVAVNFGQRPFTFTPSAGYNAPNTQNLPAPTIINGARYFDTALYTGTGSSLSITGELFSPDLVWIKSRSAATDHSLYDSSRGVQLQLESNNPDAETTQSTGLTAFNSDGFTVGSLAQVNTNAATYAAWQWDEGATPGFDVVTYTGTGVNRTIAHDLGATPQMMFVKRRNASDTWRVYHSAIGATQILQLNLTDAQQAFGTGTWNNTAPTSSVFSVGTNSAVNANGSTYVAYLWSEVANFSRFGSYVGNGVSDGPFIWLGFRPAFFLVKASSGGTAGSQGWAIADNRRLGFNLNGSFLAPNSSAAEGTGNDLDLVSNGIKLRGGPNESGTTYVFAAFAENPFKIARAR